MNKEEIMGWILQIIDEQQGSITADEIYQRLIGSVDPGRTQETIRKYIRELVSEESWLIGSSSRGYFRIRNRDQLREAINSLDNRIGNIRGRRESLRQAWNQQNPENPI
jgi:predicted transcriptional regulator